MSSPTCCCPRDNPVACAEVRHGVDLRQLMDLTWDGSHDDTEPCECACHDVDDDDWVEEDDD